MIALAVALAAVASHPAAVVVRDVHPEKESVAFTTNGRRWRDLSPPRIGWIDDATFVDARHGWVVSEDCTAGRGAVARTANGGRTWRLARFTSHSCSAGSSFKLDFVDTRHGWVVDVEASGGFARLWRTLDGGQSWRLLLERLPGDEVMFTTAREGWLGGYGLYRSRHGGRQWLRIGGFGERYGGFAPPRFFGSTGITAAASAHAVTAFRSDDGGRRWQRTLRVPLPSASSLFDPVTLSAPAPKVCWLSAGGHRSLLYVSSDGGRNWTRRSPLPPRTAGPLQALDARTAVLPIYRKHGSVLVTHDGGRTWHPR